MTDIQTKAMEIAQQISNQSDSFEEKKRQVQEIKDLYEILAS